MKLKRTFLLGVVVSVALAAVMGIFALVTGRRIGDLEVKIILSTMSVGLFSLTSLVAALVHERSVWRPAMVGAFVASGFGLVTYLLSIWLLFDALPYQYEEYLARLMGVQAVWAIALPHAGLLALSAFDRPVFRWVRFVSIFMVMLLAGFITLIVMWAPHYGEDLYMRMIGVLSILTAAGTITTPVLQKVVGMDRAASVQTTKLELQIQCPRCLTTQTVATGHSRCVHCRLKFQIDIEEPRCPKCQYVLHQLTKPVCPECGCALNPDELAKSTSA